MSAKTRIIEIAKDAARGASRVSDSMYQVRTDKSVQGIVKSVSGVTVTVELIDKSIVTVSIGKRWLVTGDPCIVYGGKAQ